MVDISGVSGLNQPPPVQKPEKESNLSKEGQLSETLKFLEEGLIRGIAAQKATLPPRK